MARFIRLLPLLRCLLITPACLIAHVPTMLASGHMGKPACLTKERQTDSEADGQTDTQALFQPVKQTDG